MKDIITYHDLDAYKLAFKLSLNVLHLTSKFNPCETDLKGKLLKSSTTIAVKIAESWCKRSNPSAMQRYLMDAEKAVGETQACLNVGLEYQYIHVNDYHELEIQYEQLKHKMAELHVNYQLVN